MENLDVWPLLWGALDALTSHYGPAIDSAAAELGIPVGQWYGWLMAARIFEPEPVSAERLHVRSAYTAPAQLEASLAKGAGLGLLEPKGQGDYCLTAAGHAAVERLIRTARAAMAGLRPLAGDDLLRLASLLRRVVDASLDAPEPPGKWCLRIARHYDPGVDAPVMERLDQYLSDLSAYRDDSHLASWRPTGVSGQAWDVLTLIWRGVADDLDQICTRKVHRGFTREEYAVALEDLIERGWIVHDSDRYCLTELGESVRSQAEVATYRYFYAPWACLSEEELADVRQLLERFRDALSPTRH
jgi:hypothetical protein